jgi:SAM-dependent methyltransferase
VIFRREPLAEIIDYLRAHAPVTIRVLDPDRGRGHYAGEIVDDHVHRPFRVWVDLADRLDLRLRTPRVVGEHVELTFEPLDPEATWDREPEKYSADAAYQRITKLEDPGFVIDFLEALDRVAAGPRILSLGCNTGDELVLVTKRYPDAQITGIDRDASALAVAHKRFPTATFIETDLAQPLPVGRFDLVVCIGTLQSGNLDDRDLLRRIVQDHAGAVIFGIPNCRYLDGEQRSGARMKNFAQPELGLLVKDVAFYRKYLQQHDREVWVTGKTYLLVTARSRADRAASTPDPARP